MATLAIFLPAAILIYAVAHIWSRFKGARVLVALENGLRPVAAGLVLAAVYVLMCALGGGFPELAVTFGATVLLMSTRINPLPVILGGAAVFLVLFEIGIA